LRLTVASLVAAPVLASALAPVSARAATPQPVHYFSATHAGLYLDGASPLDEVIEAPDGSFFTTTQDGGPVNTCIPENYLVGCGTVVRITGGTVKAIFSFPPPATGNAVGALPAGGLVQGPDGALYGTTYYGPAPHAPGPFGFGTIFKLTQSGSSWAIQTLHVFTGGNSCVAPVDGALPNSRLVFGPDGFLYGTTSAGGCYLNPMGFATNNGGTIFRIATDGSGYANLYNMEGSSKTTDPAAPQAGLTPGPGGLLYGTSELGGAVNDGTVFAFNPATDAVALLHSFSGLTPDGGEPFGALTLGSDGLLWGTTYTSTSGADPTYYGTVFNISPTAPFTLTSFPFTAAEGALGYERPLSGVIEGSDGNYYGATPGAVLYSISETGVLSELGTFSINGGESNVSAVPLQAANGKMYGTLESLGPTKNGFPDRGNVWDYSGGLKKPKPLVNWFLPGDGAVGSSVVIAGANFVGASAVVFQGTTTSSSFSVGASGFITATVPSGAVSGPVKIMTPAGTVTSTVSFAVP
jgi:uncharacterized repeat protein (TIGR03803 family)